MQLGMIGLLCFMLQKSAGGSTSIGLKHQISFDQKYFGDLQQQASDSFFTDRVTADGENPHSKRFRSRLELLRQEVSAGVSVSPKMVPMESAKISHRTDLVKVGRATPEFVHTLVLRCKPRNRERLREILHDVSDPRSANYGKHLTHQEVLDLTANRESAAHIVNYLTSQGVRVLKRSLGEEYITAEAPISQWEAILDTEFFEYYSTVNPSQYFVRALSYSIPEYLEGHVEAVFKTTQFPHSTYQKFRAELLKQGRRDEQADWSAFHANSDSMSSSGNNYNSSISSDGQSVRNQLGEKQGQAEQRRRLGKYIDGTVTPQLLNDVYNIDSNAGSSHASQGVYETIGQSYSPVDLQTFQEKFDLPVESVFIDIGGHEDNHACDKHWGNDCIEANLDIQYLMAVAQHVPSWYYYWEGPDFLLDWAQAMVEMSSPPQVMSISYGIDELELPDSYRTDFEDVAAQLGAMGVTIVASAGDDGAVSSNARSSALYCGYAPSFPASSPYVTAVGATQGPETDGGEEVACSSDTGGIITTGGGFSSIFPLPDWQRSQIESYKASVAGTSAEGVPGYGSGRGYPDVSLLGYNYAIIVKKASNTVSGTSASSPVFAGMVALVNSARLEAGKSPLGWLNPSLYLEPEKFVRDVTKGNNHCAAVYSTCCAQGFKAVAGWDPVTGLGSVDFAAMKQVLLGYGDYPNSPTPAPSLAPGEVSKEPVLAPTHAPTHRPSAMPSSADGWLILNDYKDEDCQGIITGGLGVPTGRCLVEYNAQGDAVGSTMYICTQYNAYSHFYTDLSCSEEYLFEVDAYGLGCAYHAVDYYYSPRVYSTDIQCMSAAETTSGSTGIPPLPSYDGTFVQTKSYDSRDGCEGDLVSEYGFYRNGYCFNSYSDGQNSYMYQYPHFYYFKQTDCSPNHEQQKLLLSDECTLNYYYFSVSPFSVAAEAEDEAVAGIDAGDSPLRQNQQRHRQRGGSWSGEPGVQAQQPWSSPQRPVDTEEYSYYYFDQFFGSTDLFMVWENGDVDPMVHPTKTPTHAPSRKPSRTPSHAPSFKPSDAPSFQPSDAPSFQPSDAPSFKPSDAPSFKPSDAPSFKPSSNTLPPTEQPFFMPTLTMPPNPTHGPSNYAPSKKPSTPPPTDSSLLPYNERVKMFVAQTLTGIDVESFKSGGDGAEKAFRFAVAKALPGIEAKNVIITARAQVVNEMKSVAAVRVEGTAPLTAKCQVGYTLDFETFDVGFKSALSAFTAFSADIQVAVDEGQFDAYLQQYADVYRVAALLAGVQCDAVAINEAFEATPVDGGASSNSNDDGSGGRDSGGGGPDDVTAVVVTVVVLAVVMGLLTLGCVYREKLGCMGKSYGAINTDSQHPSVVAVPGGRPTVGNHDPDDDGDIEGNISAVQQQVGSPAGRFFRKVVSGGGSGRRGRVDVAMADDMDDGPDGSPHSVGVGVRADARGGGAGQMVESDEVEIELSGRDRHLATTSNPMLGSAYDDAPTK